MGSVEQKMIGSFKEEHDKLNIFTETLTHLKSEILQEATKSVEKQVIKIEDNLLNYDKKIDHVNGELIAYKDAVDQVRNEQNSVGSKLSAVEAAAKELNE